MNVCKMRNLRHKHSIKLTELSAAAKRPSSWFSKVELGNKTATIHNQQVIIKAFEDIISSRRSALYTLERDFIMHKNHLFDKVRDGETL